MQQARLSATTMAVNGLRSVGMGRTIQAHSRPPISYGPARTTRVAKPPSMMMVLNNGRKACDGQPPQHEYPVFTVKNTGSYAGQPSVSGGVDEHCGCRNWISTPLRLQWLPGKPSLHVRSCRMFQRLRLVETYPDVMDEKRPPGLRNRNGQQPNGHDTCRTVSRQGSLGLMKAVDCMLVLKALGEMNRLRIMRLLMSRELDVNTIAERLELTEYNVSKHLRILKEAGLLEMQKDGKQRLYGIVTRLKDKLAANGNVLELGCCTFRFDKFPK